MKKFLIILIVLIIGFQLYTRRNKSSVTVRPDGVALANGVLKTATLDINALHKVSATIEKACSRNRFGLSEAACIEKIRERKDQCEQATAQNFPGQIDDVNRLQEVTVHYVDCIFKQ